MSRVGSTCPDVPEGTLTDFQSKLPLEHPFPNCIKLMAPLERGEPCGVLFLNPPLQFVDGFAYFEVKIEVVTGVIW